MVKEFSISQMEIDTKVNLLMTGKMATEFIFLNVVLNTKETMLMERDKAVEF